MGMLVFPLAGLSYEAWAALAVVAAGSTAYYNHVLNNNDGTEEPPSPPPPRTPFEEGMDRIRGTRVNPETGERENWDREANIWRPANPPWPGFKPYNAFTGGFDVLTALTNGVFGGSATYGFPGIASIFPIIPPTSSGSPVDFPGIAGFPGSWGGAGYPGGPSGAVGPAVGSYGGAARTISPLVLDLDGDGIETTNLQDGVFFDHDVDGFAERSGWVGQDDGILVYDRNNDGFLTDGTEVFGDYTPVSGGGTASNGFAALADLDTNADGKIDQNDALFSQLKVLKGDGELYSLSDLDIKSLNLSYSSVNQTDSNGNTEIYESSFEKNDGSILKLSDYNFVRDTTYKLDMVSEEFTTEVASMPVISGYGKVNSLQQAMLIDTSGQLKELVVDFMSESDPDKRSVILDQILIKWAGSVNVDPNATITWENKVYFDAQKLDVLEKFIGYDYVNTLSPGRIAWNQGALLSEAYRQLKENFYAQLMAQTHFASLFSQLDATYNEDNQFISYDITPIQASIDTLLSTDSDAGKIQLSEFARVIKGTYFDQAFSALEPTTPLLNWQQFYDHFSSESDEYKWIMDTAGLSTTDGTNGNDQMVMVQSISNVIYGNDGDDYINGRDGNDFIDGGSGIDTIYGGNDNDWLKGGTGSDSLFGGTGDDRVQGDDGNDWVRGDDGNDTLLGNAGNDNLIGGTGNDSLDGGADNDQLTAGDGNDTLIGGTGKDTLAGGSGNDVYEFNSGDGLDVITETSGTDTIKFGIGITLADLTFSAAQNYVQGSVANGLAISITGGSDQIIIKNQLGSDNALKVEKLEFSDGSFFMLDGVSSLLETQGTSANDVLYGSDFAEKIYGNDGADLLKGNAGNDSLYGGTGSDNLHGGSGQDILSGGDDNDQLFGEEDEDQLFGDAGNDTLSGGSANDTLTGGLGDDNLDGGDGNDTYVFANSWGIDTISADSSGTDTLDLSAVTGNLTINLVSGVGNEVSDGTNTINWSSNIIENVKGGSGNDSITGSTADNRLDGGTGNDTLSGSSGNDTYAFSGSWGTDSISDSAGTDTIDFTGTVAGVTINLTSGVGNEASDGTNTVNWASSVIENAIGGSGNDTITGNTSVNRLEGGVGNDNLDGGAGDDTYAFSNNWGVDTISADSSGTDTIDFGNVTSNVTINLTAGAGDEASDGINTLNWSGSLVENASGGAGNDSITGSSTANVLVGNNGNDTIMGLGGNDSLDGGAGDDTYLYASSWGADTITADSSGSDTVDLSAATNAVTINLVSGVGNEISDGTSTVNWSGDVIENAIGGSGADTITGNTSANRLAGNGGNDSLDGGAGDDTYVFSGTWGADAITADSAGTDTVDLSSVSANLTINLVSSGSDEVTDGTNTVNWSSEVVENAIGGSGNDNIIGNSSANILIGSDGNDTITGAGGSDSLDGGSGNDSYLFANTWGIDTITGDASGTDTVDLSTVTTNLTVNLTSSVGNEVSDGTNTIDWSGNVIENVLAGSGNDTLTGNTANNNLDGGSGNDTYIFTGNFGLDTVADTAGTDTVDLSGVIADLEINLASGGSDEVTDGTNTVNWSSDVIENVIGGSGADTMTGNSSANILTGNAGNDSLTGNGGNDSLDGGAGDDSYVFSGTWGADTITADSSGTDTVDLSSASANLTINLVSSGSDEVTDGTNTVNWSSDVIENAIGGSGADTITGNTSANCLTGNGGNDSLDGGAGDDSYVFSGTWGADTITADSSGTDTVDLSSASANLTINLVSSGSDEVTDGTNTVNWSSDVIENAIGGSGNDTIIGNGDNNILTGNAGNDSLNGGAGSDYLDGGDGADTLEGGAGSDTLNGGSGNDVYIFQSKWNSATIDDAAGTDTIDLSSINDDLEITLTSSPLNEVNSLANTINWSSDAIENVISGSGDDYIYDNGSTNTIIAGSGNDTLIASGGSDLLDGGDGDDTYLFANDWGTTTITADSAGNDTIDFSYIAADLTINLVSGGGNEATDGTNTVNWSSDIIENAKAGYGNDTLIGNSDSNNLDGGSGNDTYLFNSNWGADTISDSLGTDTVDLSAASANLTINLVSSGSDEVTDGTNTVNWSSNVIENAIGGSGNDTITGNSDANRLTGNGGNDSLDAGAGDDTYVFSGTWGADTITADSAGTDTVDLSAASANLTINLVSSGSDEVTDETNTVNWSSNVIENAIGGSGNDTITGNTSANRLEGGAGNDSLDGGSGNDTYVFGNNWGVDSITADSAGTDTVDFSVTTANLTINLVSGAGNEVSDGTNTVNWSSNVIENAMGGSGNDTISGNSGNNTLDGGSGDDSYIFSSSWGVDTIGDSTGTDTLDLSAISAALTVNLTSGGGNEVSDGTNTINWDSDVIENIKAGSGNDIITGSSADNIITGGAGNDTLDGGAGNDTYVYTNGWGVDTISDSAGTDTLDLSAVTSDVTINMISSVGDEISDGTNTINWDSNVIETVILGSGNGNISGSSGNNSLVGGIGNDTFSAGAGNDTLIGGLGNDSLDGGADDDLYSFSNGWGIDTISDSAGSDSIDLSTVSADLTVNLVSGVNHEITDGTNTVDWSSDVIEHVSTGTGFDNVTGNSSANNISTGLGDDTINGGAGNDTLDGGEGHDTYVFASSWGIDTIIDSAGNDTVDLSAINAGVTVNLTSSGGNEVTDGTNTINWTGDIIENVISGSGSDNLTGSSASNILDGGAGSDNLNGADGDDTYQFRNGWGLDSIQDSAGADTVNFSQVTSALTITLTAGAGHEVTDGTVNHVDWTGDIIENAKGGTNNDSITGSSGDNELYGNEGNDTLTGGAGNDTGDGGFGNDLFKFSNSWGSDLVVDDDGTDTVDLSSVTVALTVNMASELASDEVSDGNGNVINWNENTTIENLVTGSGNDTIAGNELDNVITAGSGNDSVDGGDGNDTYVYNSSWGTDTITGDASGSDTVDLSSISAALTINLTSSGGNEVSDGTNTINWASDVIENINSGSGADSITGSGNANNLIGNAGNDTISAGDGNDTLTGGANNDSLDGGAGDDTYVFGNTWGVDIISADSAGIDTVDLSGLTSAVTVNLVSGGGNEISSSTNTVNWSSDVIENAIGGSGNDTLTGNSAANILTGNAGNDTITGAAGDDSLDGGDGNDRYIFANNWGADVITAESSGTDTLDLSSVTSSLTINLTSTEDVKISDGTNSVAFDSDLIEVVLSGAGNDVITGTSGNNTLGGGAGNDVIDGGAGDDTYVFGNAWGVDTILDSSGTNTIDFSSDTSNGITVNLVAGAGNEVVSGSHTVNWTGNIIRDVVGSSAADNITGNSDNNNLYGGSGDDTIDGGTGDDYMDGGLSNDTFKFTGSWGHDTVVAAAGGRDTADFSAISAAVTINLASGVGAEATDGTNTVNWDNNDINCVLGGSGNDTITGSGVDTLNGGAGNDTLNGGSSNDIFAFTGTWGADTIASDVGGTADTVDLSTTSTALTINLVSGGGNEITDGTNTVNWSTDFIENVNSGSGNDTVTGNSSANLLQGNDGNDTISGADGNDTLQGGNGNDSLIGGIGDDQLDATAGSNTMDGGAGNDTYQLTDYTNGADTIIDSTGSDTVEIDLNVATTINLNAGAGDEVTLSFLGNTRTWNWTGNIIENATGGFAGDSITGNADANRLDGNSGNDTISGGDGNDTLIGGTGSDSLDGGANDDTYTFGSSWGVDTIAADASGTDTVDFTGNTSAVTVNLTSGAGNEASQGSNTVNWASDIIENVIGGTGADTITGNGVANVLDGQGGNDTILGGAGNDTLIGGAGNDSLDGGANDDTYTFGSSWGVDTIAADASGTDTVDFTGNTSAVTVNLTSGAGNEASQGSNTVNWASDIIENVIGGTGADSITGNSGANRLDGSSGNDTISGGTGNDTLIGGVGSDSLDGGANDDTYIFGNGWGQDTITDAGGTDTLDLSAVTTTLTAAQLYISFTADEFSDGTNTINWDSGTIENVITGVTNDTIFGNSVANSIISGDGDDYINSFEGDDTILAGTGADILNGSDGNDSLDGGSGNDQYVFSGTWGQDTIADASGTDRILLDTVTADLTINLVSGAGNEVSDGTNTVNWSSDVIENVLSGSGNDSIIGTASANEIYGGAGNDTIQAGDGSDILYGDAGNDSLDGGDSYDYYYFNNTWGNDTITDSSGSFDRVSFDTVTSNLTINLTSSGSDEVSDGTNTVNWSGSVIEDAFAGQGNDSVTGSSIANSLWGYLGNDTLLGLAGNDVLDGGSGDDDFTGGTGNDTLYGGSGNDTFRFTEGDGQDAISDSAGTDNVLFDSSVTQSVVAIFKTAGGDLQIGYTDSSGDLVTIQNFGTSGNQVEDFVLNSGYHMTDADINQVISDMANYASAHSISFTSLSDVKNDANLMAIVNGGWHS